MKRLAPFACFGLLLLSCSAPRKAVVPSLNPQQAGELLHYNNKAQDWLKYVHRRNPACVYQLTLPDQTNHPTTIDLTHIVVCSNRPSPMEFDASISFAYNAATGGWAISRFAS